MRILVTGGAGFIGSNIVDAYLKVGHNVFIIDNLSTGRREFINPKAIFIEADIRDEKKIAKIFDNYNFEIINHHAAQIDLRKSVENPGYDVDVNVVGSINLLQNAVKHNIKKFIFASTGGAMYGEHDYFPADENHPTRPYAPYGINKLTIEKYLYFYHHVYGLEYVIFRYANIYGPRQNPYGECGVIAIFTEKFLNNIQPVINGSGKQTRDYVYVNDVVDANILALNAEASSIYNLGTGVETSVNYIFRELNRLSGAGFGENHGPAKKGEQIRSVLSYKKVKNELGWLPKVNIDEGLKLTMGFFKNSGSR
jgi:UDP-glucose 4-epimerase